MPLCVPDTLDGIGFAEPQELNRDASQGPYRQQGEGAQKVCKGKQRIYNSQESPGESHSA